jgi:hypothetical protein
VTTAKKKRGRPLGAKTQPKSHVEKILEALEKRVGTGLSDMELKMMLVLLQTVESKANQRDFGDMLRQWEVRLEEVERYLNTQQSLQALQSRPRSPGPPVGPPRQTPMTQGFGRPTGNSGV